jgi:hypothetical protein
VTRRRAGATYLAAVLTLGACGTTYIDSTVTVPDSDVTTTTFAPVDPAAPIADLLGEIETLMFDLDERIIDEDRHVETFARIDDLWSAADRQIRADDPDDIYNFEQAIELARTGVERLRPADASKGYKIIRDVIDAYLDRG